MESLKNGKAILKKSILIPAFYQKEVPQVPVRLPST
jgi:hypothetical protein